MTFVARVLRYLRKSGMPPTVFGRRTVNDPRFVDDLLNGREPRARTGSRVIAWIDEQEAAR
jgi:hypothetical protein